MYLYSVTAVIDNKPAACWLIASDSDEAMAKAGEYLPEGGKLKHCIGFGPATLPNLKNNKLIQFVPKPNAIEFTCKALLELIQAQAKLNSALSEAVELLSYAVKNRIPPPTEDTEP